MSWYQEISNWNKVKNVISSLVEVILEMFPCNTSKTKINGETSLSIPIHNVIQQGGSLSAVVFLENRWETNPDNALFWWDEKPDKQTIIFDVASLLQQIKFINI